MALRRRSNSAAVGFTLIELLVALGIIALLLAAALPTYHLFLQQTTTQDASSVYVQQLRRAQSLAQNGRGDSAWGVIISGSSITLFKGTSYSTRDSSYDENYALGAPATVSGVVQVDFAKLTGLPSQSGTTTISVAGGQTATITINAKGFISY